MKVNQAKKRLGPRIQAEAMDVTRVFFLDSKFLKMFNKYEFKSVYICYISIFPSLSSVILFQAFPFYLSLSIYLTIYIIIHWFVVLCCRVLSCLGLKNV